MKTKLSPRLILSVLALSLGMATSALAMPPRGEGIPGNGPGMHAGSRMHDMRGLMRLHDDLKLDAKQEALWQEARKATQDNMSGMRDQHRKQHDEIVAQLNQPGADLRVVLKRMDTLRAEGQKQRMADRERWLAVYDVLNAEQKEKVRLFFKSSMDRKPGMARGEGRRGSRGPATAEPKK